MESETMELEPERLVAKVGSVGIDLNHLGLGRVVVDGREMPMVRRVVIDAAAGEVPRVTLEVIPLSDPDHPAADPNDPIIVRGVPCPT